MEDVGAACASNRSLLHRAGAPGGTQSGEPFARKRSTRKPASIEATSRISTAKGVAGDLQFRTNLSTILLGYVPFFRWSTHPCVLPLVVRSFLENLPQNFLNLQEFPGYTSVRPCLVRHVSTVVPYECHVFVGAKGRRIVVRRKEIAFFSHCWDLPPDKVRTQLVGNQHSFCDHRQSPFAPGC